MWNLCFPSTFSINYKSALFYTACGITPHWSISVHILANCYLPCCWITCFFDFYVLRMKDVPSKLLSTSKANTWTFILCNPQFQSYDIGIQHSSFQFSSIKWIYWSVWPLFYLNLQWNAILRLKKAYFSELWNLWLKLINNNKIIYFCTTRI